MPPYPEPSRADFCSSAPTPKKRSTRQFRLALQLDTRTDSSPEAEYNETPRVIVCNLKAIKATDPAPPSSAYIRWWRKATSATPLTNDPMSGPLWVEGSPSITVLRF